MAKSEAVTNAKIQKTLLPLAPADLQIHRKDRYDGSGFDITLSQFAPEDVSLIIQLYHAVKRAYDLWLYMVDSPNFKLLRQQIVSQFGSEQFLSSARSIGAATYALGNFTPALRKIIHDIRGGALVILAGYASFVKAAGKDESIEEDIRTAILMARDHAKLMRNAIVDLDPAVRQADESVKIHYITDFVKKWHGSIYKIADKAVDISVDCTFAGSITNRCLETSAIDRVLYNIVNNAARFAADNKIILTIFPVGEALVRWVVENAITSEHEAWLNDVTGSDLSRLFFGGLTRGGHGIGLSGCADFVAAGFGLSPEEAITHGYLGARIIDARYYAWFHWPVYKSETSNNEPVCECSD